MDLHKQNGENGETCIFIKIDRRCPIENTNIIDRLMKLFALLNFAFYMKRWIQDFEKERGTPPPTRFVSIDNFMLNKCKLIESLYLSHIVNSTDYVLSAQKHNEKVGNGIGKLQLHEAGRGEGGVDSCMFTISNILVYNVYVKSV